MPSQPPENQPPEAQPTDARPPDPPVPPKAALLAECQRLGFDVCGVAPVSADIRREVFFDWLADGKHGEMAWMARDPARRTDPARVLPEVRSIICVGMNYYQPDPSRRGRIAKYALGGDYHKLIDRRLKQLCRWLREHGGINRPYVDTGPVLEKPIAVGAGIGWQAKSTMLLHPRLGTWLFLGEVLTSLDFAPDAPMSDHCGKCTACIDVCPTQAITAPYQLDARRCIAYLTIEHHGEIPLEFRDAIGDHLYGCDDCLDVCPWNRWAQRTREERFAERPQPDLREMLDWDETSFATAFAGSPIKRIGLSRWRRNICVVLGNIGDRADLPALEKAAANSDDPLAAVHASWALEKLRAREADNR